MAKKQYRTPDAIEQRIEDLVVEAAISYKVLLSVRLGKRAYSAFQHHFPREDNRLIVGVCPKNRVSFGGNVSLVCDPTLPPDSVEPGEETTDGSVQL